MKSLNLLMQEIIQLTAEIETNYPELYRYFGETPLRLSETKKDAITSHDLEQYLESLKVLLQHHIETHK